MHFVLTRYSQIIGDFVLRFVVSVQKPAIYEKGLFNFHDIAA